MEIGSVMNEFLFHSKEFHFNSNADGVIYRCTNLPLGERGSAFIKIFRRWFVYYREILNYTSNKRSMDRFRQTDRERKREKTRYD